MAKTKKAAPGKFPAVLVELEKRVNGGEAGEIDFEMYQSFNEQYKPSDWTNNPASNEEFLTFGMDGSGGQVAIWRAKNAEFDDLPVVFLGSEGEVAVFSTSLAGFINLLAAGVGPYQASAGEFEDAEENEDMLAWLKKAFPKYKAQKPAAILAAAQKAHPDFEEKLMAQRTEKEE